MPTISRYQTQHSDSSSNSDRSSRNSPPTSIPSLDQSGSTSSRADSELSEYGKASVNTYCTTVESINETEEYPPYDYYQYHDKAPRNEATPATPAEFAHLYPSVRRFQIRHDNASADGDMNIRVDTNVNDRNGGVPKYITLFHLRMYDLQKREFSLRRYGRDCGREVAHTHQKVEKPTTPRRPALQRTVSKALHSIRGKSEHEKQISSLSRQDSGYGSVDEEMEDAFVDRPKSREGVDEHKSANTIKLEFSNYAHVEVTRKGSKTSRKYDYEYWGKNYSWKRLLRKLPATGEEEISYQLVNNCSGNIVAVILPDPVSPLHIMQETTGEFVPPCSLYLKDSLQDPIFGPADVAE